MNHKGLVDITALKVQSVFKCGLVLKEPRSIRLNFSPDVFAVKKGGVTFQFEIKVSRSDFLKDINKPHRKEEKDIGTFRYFVVPWGLISPDDVLFETGHMKKWGLIWVSSGETNRFRIMRGVKPKNNLKSLESTQPCPYDPFKCVSNSMAEMELVYSAHRALVLGSKGGPVPLGSIIERPIGGEELKSLCSRIR